MLSMKLCPVKLLKTEPSNPYINWMRYFCRAYFLKRVFVYTIQVYATIRGFNAASLSSIATSNGVFISRFGADLPPLSPFTVYDGYLDVHNTEIDLYVVYILIYDVEVCNNESACGLVKQCRTQDHQPVSSIPASANVFVSLGKILSLNCFVDLSASGRYRSWEILQSKC